MPKTKMIAKIKKIDITNKVTSENWSQTISITLSDIELNDDNLIAIRKFRPNEEVQVKLSNLQLTLDEIAERERLKKECPYEGSIEKPDEVENVSSEEEEPIDDVSGEDPVDDPLFEVEYDVDPPDPSKVLKRFDFK